MATGGTFTNFHFVEKLGNTASIANANWHGCIGGREKAALYATGSGQTKECWLELDSGLEIKHDPCWGMVARVFLPARPSVNTAVRESDR